MKKTSSKIKTSPQEKFLHVLNVFSVCIRFITWLVIPCLTVQGHPWREFISCQRASHWMHIR